MSTDGRGAAGIATELSDLVAKARALVERADGVLVLTGAGISAESGVPTFRGAGGLWKSYRAESLATPEAFARDPRLVWEWYGWRRDQVKRCRPNAAHLALARLASRRRGVTIATQNVDGLHFAAARDVMGGSDMGSGAPIELHGSLFRVRCLVCGRRREHRAEVDASSAASLPHCADCGGLVRPDIVWFGEALESHQVERATVAAAAADVCLVVGTSAVVYPAASFALITRNAGGCIIEINPEATPLTPLAAISLRATAVGTVPDVAGVSPPPGGGGN